MNIGFVGLGKLGLPCALAIESRGHKVVGYDPSEQVKDIIDTKKLQYQEIWAQEHLDKSKIEITSIDDKIHLNKPKQINIKWIVKSNNKNTDSFLNAVREIKWLDKKPYVWVACEFTKMKFLRDYFQKEKKICKNEMYISSYWKSGLVEEEHKIVKKEDSLVWND